MASQPIILIRTDGVAIRPSRTAPTTMPRGMVAMSSPTVGVLPCSECAYGAASPSGMMQRPAGQPDNSRSAAYGCQRRSGSRPADTAHGDGRDACSRRGKGRGLTYAATIKGRDTERDGLQAQRPVRVNHGDDRRARDESPGSGSLEADVADRGAKHELVARQHIRQHGDPGRRERHASQYGAEQQRTQCRERAGWSLASFTLGHRPGSRVRCDRHRYHTSLPPPVI